MGMKSPAKKKEIVKRSRPTDAELGKIDSNNGDAGKIISDLTAGHKSIEYEARDIALYDIRVNADNEIFRQADTQEDIVQLAEDIQRNGLMHNLVVFPQEENGKTVYVLLSGERRYRAIEYLEKRGDATWNTIKNCNVITTSLSENEKKVLLYSANLQVRGGFADEQIRRKAVAEFVVCLQNEPFNMTEKDAKKAIKEVSATTAKQIDRDFRIEEKLDKELLRLLDNKFLTRMECESYITLEAEEQHKIAQCYLLLSAVDVSNCDTDARERLLQECNSIHYDFIRAIDRARKTNEPDERDERLETAFAECENAIRLLQNRVGEYRDAVSRHDTEKAEEIAKDVARDQEAKRVEPMPESLDPQALTDATVAVSFGADDISETDGKTELTLTVYDYDIYDMVDIAQLAVGDTIVVDGKDMVVTSREDENGFVTINGGLEQGGVDLTSDDSGVYYAVGLDDTKSYHELGKVTVPVAEGFVLTDNADPEHPDETYAAADLAELAASEPGFTANNTLATIEHGKLTVLVRSYTP